MRNAIPLLFLLLLVVPFADALGQSCSGQAFDRFKDGCRAKSIEVETRDDELVRIDDGDRLCFHPSNPKGWSWFCRGYEEDADCNDPPADTAVRARLNDGFVEWECFEE